MSIKHVKPSKRNKGGIYHPLNVDKYVGKYPIICRSSWERKYCQYCDLTDSIVKWASEVFEIKYINPLDNPVNRKPHTYYPDYYIKVKTGDRYKEYIVEIKPKAQTIKPRQPKKATAKSIANYKYAVSTYIKNLAKAKAATNFALERGMEYIVLTEDSIK